MSEDEKNEYILTMSDVDKLKIVLMRISNYDGHLMIINYEECAKEIIKNTSKEYLNDPDIGYSNNFYKIAHGICCYDTPICDYQMDYIDFTDLRIYEKTLE